VKECWFSFVLCVLAVSLVLCGGSFWLVDHLYAAALRAKEATIEKVKEERDSAEKDSATLRTDKQSLMTEKEQLSKENAALKKTGAFVPEKLFFDRGDAIPGEGDNFGLDLRFNISNGVPNQPIKLQLKTTPETATINRIDTRTGNSFPSVTYNEDKRLFEIKCFPPDPTREDFELEMSGAETLTFSGENLDHELKLKLHPVTNAQKKVSWLMQVLTNN